MAALGGKATIVTGSSSGIGSAIAQRLAADGAAVLLCARNEATLEGVADTIHRRGGTAEWRAEDLSDPQAGVRLVQAALEHFGRVDVIVNCASATRNAPFLELSDEEWVQGFEIKVFAAMRLCRAAWSELAARRGAIVNICGVGGRTPRNIYAMSSLLSPPLYALTKVLADLGLQDGVRVNAVNPGPVYTPRLCAQIDVTASKRGVEPAVVEEEMRVFHKMTRWGRPEDTANLVSYILSSQGELLNGAILDLDGGATQGI